ncbi:MAG: hypothetical protein K2Y56_09415 [Methylobacterium sp.]|uniref:hypothetical protein n=1 Tax=Methylobacterium sp. TaxID=409 RepID=UPI0025FA1934|nr:hypothetical protein [Methylobacterium sp.]MBX9931739.1 hypothetical protein [Methylobacterium sp.]
MTITMSINAVGLVRATEMLQSARNETARDENVQGAGGAKRSITVEIGRSVDAETREAESEIPLPASQKRAVDILV